jgi:hypothetical protein
MRKISSFVIVVSLILAATGFGVWAASRTTDVEGMDDPGRRSLRHASGLLAASHSFARARPGYLEGLDRFADAQGMGRQIAQFFSVAGSSNSGSRCSALLASCS